MASLGADFFTGAVNGNFAEGDFWFGAFFILMFFAPALFCIPILVDQLLHKHNGLKFGLVWRIWLVLLLGVYSMLMLMLATSAFQPDWKGSKGFHWFYYALDSPAGLTLWPIYALGVGLFIFAVLNPVSAKRNPIYLVGVGTCAAISIWYTAATLFLNFTAADGRIFAMVPGATGVGYCLYCAIIWRNREFTWEEVKSKWLTLVAWFGGLFVSILAKYPLAFDIYNKLPDERPTDCFIVTAATRGHRGWVGTWYDENQNRLLNQQLLTFWKLEDWLRSRAPRMHRLIRRCYNRIGPVVARSIVFRWQADLVYLLLKPLELLSRCIVGFVIHSETDS